MIVVNKSIQRETAERAIEEANKVIARAQEFIREDDKKNEQVTQVASAEEVEHITLYGEKRRTDIPALYMDFRYPKRKNHGAGLWQVSGIFDNKIRHHIMPHLPDMLEKMRPQNSRCGKGDSFNHTHFFTQLMRNALKDPRNIRYMTEDDACQCLIKTL